MPHIHLQTTGNVHGPTIEECLEALVACLCSFDSINSAAVKAYHSLRPVWVMGSGAPEGFVSCQVSLLNGRDEVLRKKIADAMYSVLCDLYSEEDAAITLEIREMDAATYRK